MTTSSGYSRFLRKLLVSSEFAELTESRVERSKIAKRCVCFIESSCPVITKMLEYDYINVQQLIYKCLNWGEYNYAKIIDLSIGIIY